MELGRLRVPVIADLAQFQSGLAKAEVQAKLAGSNMSVGLGKASGAAKNLEKDLTSMGQSAAGGIPLLGGLGSSIGGLPLPALAAAAALGALAIAGKSVVDISDKWESAGRNLEQATATAGVSYAKATAAVDSFIASNKKFVSNQAEVRDAWATLTRSGLQQSEVQRDMNIALDLAALKHKSLSEAVDLVDKAEHGRMKGLIDLGIVTKSMTDAQGNLIGGTKSVAAAMDALEAKTKSGRVATADLAQKQNELSNAWQSFAERTGPVLVKAISFVATWFLTFLNIVIDLYGWIGDRLAPGIRAIADIFGWLGDRIRGVVTIVQELIGWLSKIDISKIPVLGGVIGGLSAGGGTPAGARVGPHRAAGGPVSPGGVYTVGERGPETLVMGNQGGSIIPAGGITVNVHGFVGNPDELFRVFREGIRRLDRSQS